MPLICGYSPFLVARYEPIKSSHFIGACFRLHLIQSLSHSSSWLPRYLVQSNWEWHQVAVPNMRFILAHCDLQSPCSEMTNFIIYKTGKFPYMEMFSNSKCFASYLQGNDSLERFQNEACIIGNCSCCFLHFMRCSSSSSQICSP
jgi:hypothetical protein